MRSRVLLALLAAGCGDVLEEGRGPFLYSFNASVQRSSSVNCPLGGPRSQEVFEAFGTTSIGFSYRAQSLRLLFCPKNQPLSACEAQDGEVSGLFNLPTISGDLHDQTWGGVAAPSSELVLFGWSTHHEASLLPEEQNVEGCDRVQLMSSVWVNAISEDLVSGGYTIFYHYPQHLREACEAEELQAERAWTGCKTEMMFRGERAGR